MPGTTGAIETKAGIPASRSALTAASRLRGAGARGSSVRAIAGVSEVTESATLTMTMPNSAIGFSKSMSRVTRSDFVVMVSGCRVSSSTSTQERVIAKRASIG